MKLLNSAPPFTPLEDRRDNFIIRITVVNWNKDMVTIKAMAMVIALTICLTANSSDGMYLLPFCFSSLILIIYYYYLLLYIFFPFSQAIVTAVEDIWQADYEMLKLRGTQSRLLRRCVPLMPSCEHH